MVLPVMMVMAMVMVMLLMLMLMSEKALDKKPDSSESASEQMTPKTGYEKALPSLLDDQFVWDQFNHRGTLLWACRGSKTGNVVANSYCASQPMVDSRWPDKKTPEGYSGFLSY